MAKKSTLMHWLRRGSQFFFLLALNPYFFLYRGFCVPAMNCWACPAAAFGCPVGAIGQFLVRGLVPFVAIGLMILAGALIGRMICGWVCPFGLIQDLMAKIGGKRLSFKFPKVLAYLKYPVLVMTVFVIPLAWGIDKTPSGVAASDFFFCNYCPAGTLEAAIPVRVFGSRSDSGGAGVEAEAVAGAEEAGEEAGAAEDEFAAEDDLFGSEATGNPDLMGGGGLDEDEGDWLAAEPGETPGAVGKASGAELLAFFVASPRMWVLYAFFALFILYRRPFCRAICPIGAMFSLLNRFSFLRVRVEKELCKDCNLCSKGCPVDNKVVLSPANQDCVRCLECVDNCRRGGPKVGVMSFKPKAQYWE
jgi:ferredoxin